MSVLPFTRIVRPLLAAMLLAAALPVAAVDKDDCGLLLLHEPGTPAGGVARKLGPGCTVKTVEVAGNADLPAFTGALRRQVQELRRQGASRVLVGGWGLAAHVAMVYDSSVGDLDGVLVLAPAEQSRVGALPELAAGLRQHAPVLWVLGSDDPMAKKGEDFAYAKAPPHPSSRFVTVKADRKGTPDAAVKPVLEWLKELE